ncbi:MAG: hypothetical protein LUG18_13605 [Candidatus Azobacteroides sp.]|nr:hypothetical protein [Candidatus Azobacteroides sp.]
MKKFFTAVSVFSLLCSSAVFAQNTAEFSDYDREYYLLMLNENVKLDYLDANPNNVIVQDLRPDDNVKNLWLWDETYVAGAATGADYYGEFDGYLSLNLSGVTNWSGGGLAVSKDFDYYVDYTKLTGDHVLHMALKSSSNISHLFILGLGGEFEW